MPGVIHPVIDIDLSFHKVQARWSRQQLNPMSLHRDGIIVGNCSLKASAQDIFQLEPLGDISPGGLLLLWLHAEASGIGGDEVVV